ncbi:tegument protein UL51 [Leporid alphaherpesvirus 4]|uniref:Tegument protein UL51 n=1 Tax=Leporid alphaherpesvirus 4 TaxID=481315 RepID=J9QQT5_9ALPH|nr:tegument protein UL51 [Leporid alphaherpesvirus 4]AFR32496.1 tegument protein UL51 [Leporid alphaherpesvirus 4]
MAGLVKSLCGLVQIKGGEYEKLAEHSPPPEVGLRIHEALTVVNALLPAPITVTDALESLDETRRLVKARSLARSYYSCVSNLERLARHLPGKDTASIDAAVMAHQEKLRRMADTCLATILQLYMTVGASDCTSDVLVSQAIRSAAESNVIMEDVAIAERALGLRLSDTSAGAVPRAPETAATPGLPAPEPPSQERDAPECGPMPLPTAPRAIESAAAAPRVRAASADAPARKQRVPVLA